MMEAKIRRRRPLAAWALVLGILGSLSLAGLGERSAEAEPTSTEGTLVVFLPPASTPLGRELRDKDLPKLREAAGQAGAAVKELEIQPGAPPEIAITPAFVFQNHRGRSIFQGRFTNAASLRNFIRTVRRLPQGGEPELRRQVPVWRPGRGAVVAPLKVTPLAGAVPRGFDAERFTEEARQAILSGFEDFRLEEQLTLGRMDRAFYMDFHPFRGDDGRLFVSVALYSQFNCIEPIFRQFDEPVAGSWEERAAVFARAAALLEEQVHQAVEASPLGDAFVPVPRAVAERSWEDLGLALPAAPPEAAAALPADLELPRRWRIAAPEAGSAAAPGLQLRFPPPLDRYAGEAQTYRGELTLGEGGVAEGASGWVEAETGSVTFGYPPLDDAIHDKILKVEEHPKARFELSSLRGNGTPLAFGTSSQYLVTGSFELMGRRIPLEITAELEPGLDAEGRPVLWARGSSQFRLADPFGIEGPDGPAPARDTMELFLDFHLVPASR